MNMPIVFTILMTPPPPPQKKKKNGEIKCKLIIVFIKVCPDSDILVIFCDSQMFVIYLWL